MTCAFPRNVRALGTHTCRSPARTACGPRPPIESIEGLQRVRRRRGLLPSRPTQQRLLNPEPYSVARAPHYLIHITLLPQHLRRRLFQQTSFKSAGSFRHPPSSVGEVHHRRIDLRRRPTTRADVALAPPRRPRHHLRRDPTPRGTLVTRVPANDMPAPHEQHVVRQAAIPVDLRLRLRRHLRQARQQTTLEHNMHSDERPRSWTNCHGCCPMPIRNTPPPAPASRSTPLSASSALAGAPARSATQPP